MFKNYWIYILLILLSLPTIFPLFHQGFFTMHDDAQVARVQQMHKALQDGQFPVRWVADLGYGYGYPLFNFYGPLPYYFGALCMFLGMSALVATKFMFAVGILGAVVSMYLLAKNIWGTFPAVFSAILYQFAPYHAVDIYVRGAAGEFWAIAILPFIFLGIVMVEKTSLGKKNALYILFPPLLVIAISYACLILTHNITAMITSVFLAIGIAVAVIYIGAKYLTLHTFSKNFLIKTGFVAAAFICGLGLSAFFWIPAFLETIHTNVNSVIGGGAHYPDHFLYLEQLWDSPWGFGGSVRGITDGMSFKAGKIHIVLTIFSLVLLGWQFITKSANKRLIVYSVCIVVTTLFAVLMSTGFSNIIWDLFPLFAFIQYPWRFLIFIIFGLSLLSGILFTIKRDIFVILLSGLLLVTILYVNTKYFMPQQYVVLDQSVYESDQYLKWWVSRISDEYMPKGFIKPVAISDTVMEKLIFEPSVSIVEETIKTHQYKTRYNSQYETSLHINLAYFPGWQVFVDGRTYPFTVKNDGIELAMPSGTHEVNVRRLNTPLQTTANYISLFCLVGVFGTMMTLRHMHGKKI